MGHLGRGSKLKKLKNAKKVKGGLTDRRAVKKKQGVECVASDYKRDCHESQVTRGLNIVADWWTGASSPDSVTNSHHTHKHTQKVSRE